MDFTNKLTLSELMSAVANGGSIQVEVWMPDGKERGIVRGRVRAIQSESGNRDRDGNFYNWNVQLDVEATAPCGYLGCLHKSTLGLGWYFVRLAHVKAPTLVWGITRVRRLGHRDPRLVPVG